MRSFYLLDNRWSYPITCNLVSIWEDVQTSVVMKFQSHAVHAYLAPTGYTAVCQAVCVRTVVFRVESSAISRMTL